MKYVFGTIIAAACGVGLAAQSPAQTTASQSPTGQPQTITVTGCLTAAPQGSPAAAPGQPGGFTLTGVAPNGGTPGAGAAGAATSYTLTGGNPSDLRAYANSRVEIQGTLQPTGAATEPGAAGVTPATPPTTMPPPAGTPPSTTPPAGTPPTATPPAGSPPTARPPAGTPPTGTPPAGTPPSTTPAPTGTSGAGAMSPTGTAGQVPSQQLQVTSVRQVPGICGGGK